MFDVRESYSFPDHPFIAAASSPVINELLQHVLDAAGRGYFNPEKCRAFLDIVWNLHCYTLEIPDEQYCTELIMKELRRLIMLFTVNEPPFSRQVLCLDDARIVLTTCCKDYVRMAPLYRYVLALRPALRVDTVPPLIENGGAVPSVPPLAEASLHMPELTPLVEQTPERSAPPSAPIADTVEEMRETDATERPLRVSEIERAVNEAADRELAQLRSYLDQRVNEVARQITSKHTLQ